MQVLTIRAGLALAAAALVTAAPAQQPVRGETYRASGTEPFWSLTIDSNIMRYRPADGPPVMAATPRVIVGFAGETYRTSRLTVNIVHARCSDGMSDRGYHDTVTVTTPRGTVRGCGGEVTAGRPDNALANTRWTVATVNGRPIQTYQPLTVNFSADRIEGRLCNGYGGDYRVVGERLTIDRVIATRMACQGPASFAESTLFRMWRQPVRASVGRWGTLILNGSGSEVTLRRAR